MPRIKPSIYKRISMDNVRTRNITALSSDENTRVNTILQKFITNFLSKHS